MLLRRALGAAALGRAAAPARAGGMPSGMLGMTRFGLQRAGLPRLLSANGSDAAGFKREELEQRRRGSTVGMEGMLPIKPLGDGLMMMGDPDTTVEQRDMRPPRQHIERYLNGMPLISRVLRVDAVRKTTKGGRVNRFRALVVCGNGKGAAGFAVGKAANVRQAILKAYAGARTRWVAVELTEDGGLHHDVQGKFNNTQVLLRSNKPYSGLKAGPIVRGILECFGVQTSTTKVIGRGAPSTVVYATFDALSRLRTPQEVSEMTGKKFVKVDTHMFFSPKQRRRAGKYAAKAANELRQMAGPR